MKALSRDSRSLGRTVAIVAFLLFVPLLAALNAVIGPYATLPYLGIAGALALFAMPLRVVLIGSLIAASVLAGLLEYFSGVSQGHWLPYLMGLLFAVRGFAQRVGPAYRPFGHERLRGYSQSVHPVTWIALLYVAIAMFGLAMALPPFMQVVVAAKNYFFVWGVLLMLLWCPWPVSSSTAVWTTVIAVACIQWPVVLYQRFIVAARRYDAAAWDAVVGTFGGDPARGGSSAAMAFFCCLAIGAVVWRAREKRLGLVWAGLLALLCLVPIALAEVKMAFVWLLVVFAVLFGTRILREPVRATLTLVLGVGLLVGLGLVYQTVYQSQRGGASTLQQIYDRQIKYALDPNEYRADHQRLGRITTLVYWAEQHDLRSDPVVTLVGHGLGASRSVSSLGMGEVARRLPLAVDGTGASTLLWDVGLLGALAFAGLLVVSAASGLRLSQREALSPAWRESAALSGAVLSMAAIGLLYNKDAIDNAAVQTLIYFSIAQVMLARRQLAAVQSGIAASDATVPPLAKVRPQVWSPVR